MKKIAFILSLVFLLSSCAANHVLFEGGASEYSIVIDKDAPASEHYAARELQTWLKEVSGVTLPIVGLNEGVEGNRLVIGYNALVEQLGSKAVKYDESDDSFTWCNKGGDIYFWGGSERGTLYGVYDFLEENLGVRWYTSKCTVTPKHDSWSFGKLYNTETPGIVVRDNCIMDVRNNPVFSARMRNNFSRLPGLKPGESLTGTAEGYWGCHAMEYHCPPHKYFAEHPEYFGMVDGVRVGTPGTCQLCLSNPDVLKICTESLRNVMRNNPDFMVYSMEQNDNWSYCTCPECNAIAEQYGGQSGLYLWFVNQVADAVKDEFPGKYVGTFAYRYTRHAPKGIVPRDNVVIRLCSIECCLLHDFDECEQNTPFVQDLLDWSSIAKNLYIWDYVTDFRHYILPIANFKLLQPKLQAFRDNHAIGVLEQGDYQTRSCELKELRAYLVSRLLWNPDVDVDAVIMDFTEGYYGAAGKYIREYIEFTDKTLRREGMHADCYVLPEHEMYTSAYVNGALDILAKGIKAVENDPELLKRIKLAQLPLFYLYLETMPCEAFKKGIDAQFKEIVAQEGIVRMSEQWDVPLIADYVAKLDKLAGMYREGKDLMPALKTRISDKKGVAYKRYEGEYYKIADMFSKGKIVANGTMSAINVDAEAADDHFGYAFDTMVEVPEDGVYGLVLFADDAAEIKIDGKTIINHVHQWTDHPSKGFANLQKGVHKVSVRYLEDSEDQHFRLTVHTPQGYIGAIPSDFYYLP